MTRMFFRLVIYLVMPVVGLATTTSTAADSKAEGIRFFESRIRPLLAKHCYECHGSEKAESELRLDTLTGIMQGGVSGMAVVPEKPSESLLMVAVSYRNEELEMPPDGRLTDRELADLARWIELGAPHPDSDGKALPVQSSIDFEAARRFWAFQIPRKSALPVPSQPDWPQTPIDHFILAKLDSMQLGPAAPADTATLLRRATFDLTGLPPTPGEIQAFLADSSADAFANAVDRLIASPRYGERWGRHWLDVARYADSNGLDENVAHGNAWHYRDYVVSAFNRDLPFDRFVTEQIAGDLLPAETDADRHQQLIATGYLSLGPKVLAEGDEQKMEMDIIDEQLDTIGKSFLGLTVACARCHDHKFDPISQDDYYALAGIFKSTETMESFKRIARWRENSIANADEQAVFDAHQERIAQQKTEIENQVQLAKTELEATLAPEQKLPEDFESMFPETVTKQLADLRETLATLEKSLPNLPTAMGVGEGTPTDLQVHLRGSHLSLGKIVPRGVPTVLASVHPVSFREDQSGRLELATWLVSDRQPLTSRVFVNRLWRWYFGRGLVASTDNFGVIGDRPSHPELLDWLAADFVEGGWSIKRLHRTILLSATYQMSSRYDARAAQIDPENHALWRRSVKRLEAESIRDSLLAVGGLLDNTMGGSSLHVGNREFLFNHTSKDETTYDSRQRSIYLPVVRNHLYDVFSLFDYSDASVSNGNRATSTIAPEALFMLNSDLLSQASRGFAESLLAASSDEQLRIELLYLRAFGRLPSREEVADIGRFLRAFTERIATASKESDTESDTDPGDIPVVAPESDVWTAVCHVILASNEFLHCH